MNPGPLGRVLVVCPSWIGDAVMSTPALRLIRTSLPGSFIGGLARPGIRDVLAGLDMLDEVHTAHPTGVLGPKRIGFQLRPRRYDAAVLLTNSFSTALIARVAGIPRRVGYDRDGRGPLLTERLRAPERPGSGALRRRWAPVPAVEYYLSAARALLADRVTDPPPTVRLEVAVGPAERASAAALLERAGLVAGARYAVINPGANDLRKRWPAGRFGAAAQHLAREHGLRVVVSGAPAEAELAQEVAMASNGRAVALPPLGLTLGSLKGVLAESVLLLTNDTGPRHIAAALGVPTVTLFGPTDPRWTTLPEGVRSVEVVADPTLPEDELADDHPDRCRIDGIDVSRVCSALDSALA